MLNTLSGCTTLSELHALLFGISGIFHSGTAPFKRVIRYYNYIKKSYANKSNGFHYVSLAIQRFTMLAYSNWDRLLLDVGEMRTDASLAKFSLEAVIRKLKCVFASAAAYGYKCLQPELL